MTKNSGAVSKKKLDKEIIFKISQLEIFNQKNFKFINGLCTLDELSPNRLLFSDLLSEKLQKIISIDSDTSCLFVVPKEAENIIKVPCLLSDNPRETFSLISKYLFKYDTEYWNQDDLIDSSADIHSSTTIMNNVSIGSNSTIGANCIIFSNVVIGPNCHIGDDVIVKSNTVIGQPGFGIFKTKEGNNEHLPHVGGVLIGDNVEIGALNTVVAGTINPTKVNNFVKTDDHVHIAHNCQIGTGTQIAACAELSGSVDIGKNCWLGPNCSIRDGLSIGSDVFIGIGANVTKSFGSNVTIAGNPAKEIV